MKKIKTIRLLYFLLFINFFFGCVPPSSNPLTKTGFFFDTVITVTLYDSNDESLLEDCFSLAEKYESMFSATLPDSDISKINRAKGKPVEVREETITLLKKGLEYCKLSNGGFDITA